MAAESDYITTAEAESVVGDLYGVLRRLRERVGEVRRLHGDAAAAAVEQAADEAMGRLSAARRLIRGEGTGRPV